MIERQGTGFFVATFLSLGLAAMACSSDDAKEEGREDAESFEPFEDAGEAEAPFEPEPFVEVLPTDADDFGSCHDAPEVAQAGHAFCPGASCGECDIERPPLDLIASANDFGEGVRFVAMKHELVLAESKDGAPVLYRFDYQHAEPQVRLAPIRFDPAPKATMRVRAMAGSADSYMGHAVLCDEASCTLYGFAQEDGNEWVAKPSSVSLPLDATGIEGAFIRFAEKDAFCIFGDGIHCRKDDGAFETIATGDGGKLLAVDHRGDWLVGENGRIVRLHDYKPIEPYRGLSARLHTVASTHDGASAWAAGEGGIFVALGERGPRLCRAPSYDILAVTAHGNGLMAWIERSGTWLEGPVGAGKRWCSWTPPIENVLSVDVFGCGIVRNRRLLSADEVRGEMLCLYD